MKRPGVRRLFRFPFRSREAVRDDVREEFEFHLDMRTRELIDSGVPPREAHAQATREFGKLDSAVTAAAAHESRRERRNRIARLLDELRQDATLGLRLMARNPWYSVSAILTLAVGIGGNTAIFSIANALLLTPLPVRAPHELARIRAGESQMSWLNYQDLARRTEAFSEMAAHRRVVAGLATRDSPVRLWGEQTTTNYFRALGVPAALGRTYMPLDDRRNLVVLAHHTWQTKFAGDLAIVGRPVVLNGRAFDVIGVMPPEFRGVAPAGLLHDYWTPIDGSASNSMLRDRRATRFEVFGRLAPGVTHAEAEARMRVAARQIRTEFPDVPERFELIEAIAMDGLGAFRGMSDLILPVLGFLGLLSVVGALVLLIGCANIGGLLLGRAAARRKEIAVRVALGAGRRRLVRQLLTESLVLTAIGGSAGVLLAVWLTGLVNPLLSDLPFPVALELRIDRRVLTYALHASTLAALVFGLAPARRAARFDVVSSLKDEAAGSAVRQRLRRTLVIGQVAVCTLLLVWSGLFLRSLRTIGSIDPGFDPGGVVLARIDLDEMSHDRQAGERLFFDLEEQVRAVPGVASAGIATVVPLSLENEEFDIVVESAGGESRRRVFANRLTPGWFDTVRIPVLAGRDFLASDRAGAPLVVIVNETAARQFWNGDAVGRRLQFPGSPDGSLEVVGVVRDSKYWTLGEHVAPTVYLPFRQHYARWMTLHVRTDDSRGTIQAIAQHVRRVAPDVFVDISAMEATVAAAVIPARVGAWLTASSGIVAVLLAALGVYGLVSFSVAQRTREIGVRKAIGAGTWDVVRLIAGEHMLMTLTGLAGGILAAVPGANVLRAFLAGVSPADTITLATTAMLVCGAALLASAVPAVRAARVNPLVVFRDV
jgi:predicted permease